MLRFMAAGRNLAIIPGGFEAGQETIVSLGSRTLTFYCPERAFNRNNWLRCSRERAPTSLLYDLGSQALIFCPRFEDATIHQMGKHRTAMKKRKGIIKYALQHGYAVTPIYTFGETNTYNTFTHFLKPRLALNKYGVPAVCFFGSWLFPLLPKSQVDLFTYVGPPLQLPKIDEPSAGDLDEWLGKYTGLFFYPGLFL